MKLDKLIGEIHSAVCESLGKTVPLSEIEIGYINISEDEDDAIDIQVSMLEGKPIVYVV